MEGLERHGPIFPNYNKTPIDPTLHPCCQKEIKSNRHRNAVEGTLRIHDRIARAERSRKLHVLDNLGFGSGCRCSYDQGDGGDYGLLILEREKEFDYDNQDGDEETQCAVAGKSIAGDTNCQSSSDLDNSDDDDSEFDYLMEDDMEISEGLKEIQEERRLELEMSALHLDSAIHHGYGAHREMHPTRVLRAAGIGIDIYVPHVAVIHLYDPESFASAKLDLLLEGLYFSGTYRGTKFLRGNGRSVALLDRELVEKSLRVGGRMIDPNRDLPCLFAVRNGEVVADRPRLSGLIKGAVDKEDVHVDDRALEEWLDHAGVLIRNPPPLDELCRIRHSEDKLNNVTGTQKSRESIQDEMELFECGVSGCQKNYQHKHIGVANDEQDGMLVSEEDMNIDI